MAILLFHVSAGKGGPTGIHNNVIQAFHNISERLKTIKEVILGQSLKVRIFFDAPHLRFIRSSIVSTGYFPVQCLANQVHGFTMQKLTKECFTFIVKFELSCHLNVNSTISNTSVGVALHHYIGASISAQY